jgi:zinc transport system ATP-binding protein
MAYITVNKLTVGYDGQTVTEDIDFSIEKGDYLCILGENGAGKSTLMKTMLRLIPPISGEIIVGEHESNLINRIGYLPQQTSVQRDFPASVWEIVLSGNLHSLGHRFFYGQEEKKRTREIMERLGIWEFKKKSYRDLSGGQQQRVLLARALCATSEAILLDEPVTGLDPKATVELYEQIKKLNEEGVTVIMISHDIHAALKDASHILHIGQKNQLYFGTKEEYLKSAAYAELEGSVK